MSDKTTREALNDFHQAVAKLGRELAKALKLEQVAAWLTKRL